MEYCSEENIRGYCVIGLAVILWLGWAGLGPAGLYWPGLAYDGQAG